MMNDDISLIAGAWYIKIVQSVKMLIIKGNPGKWAAVVIEESRRWITIRKRQGNSCNPGEFSQFLGCTIRFLCGKIFFKTKKIGWRHVAKKFFSWKDLTNCFFYTTLYYIKNSQQKGAILAWVF